MMLTNKVIILIVFALAVVFNLQSVAHADGGSKLPKIKAVEIGKKQPVW